MKVGDLYAAFFKMQSETEVLQFPIPISYNLPEKIIFLHLIKQAVLSLLGADGHPLKPKYHAELEGIYFFTHLT